MSTEERIEAFLKDRVDYEYKMERTIARRLHDARVIAREHAGRSIPTDRVWLARERDSEVNGYQVRYTLPDTDGVFVCRSTVRLSWEEWEHYDSLRKARK